MLKKINMNKELECQHEWIEKERDKRVAGFVPAGLLTNGITYYEMRILQECRKCGKKNVIIF